MGDYLVDERKFNAVVFVVALLAYGVALVDAADWAWAPLLVPLALFGLRVIWPAVPAWAVLVGTVAVVVSINIDLNAEGAYFLVCMAAFATSADSDAWIPARALLVASVLSPLIDVAIDHQPVRDWNWEFWAMGVAVSGFFGAILNHQRALTVSLALTQAQLADKVAGEERRRIAREVHDLVGHSLTVVLLHLTGARRLVRRDPDEAEAALAEAERAGRQSLGDIRAAVALLREEGDGRQPMPSGRDVLELVHESCSAGLDLTHDIVGPIETLDETVGLATYRIVQESLANVARHASGASTHVAVEVQPANVTVEVVNERGAQLDPGDGHGSGLIGMQERAAALGGSFLAGPHGRGWRVRAVLPRAGTSETVPL